MVILRWKSLLAFELSDEDWGGETRGSEGGEFETHIFQLSLNPPSYYHEAPRLPLTPLPHT